MNATTEEKTIFLTDLDHNAARVRELGYKSESVAGKDILNLILGLRDNGLTVVSMLNEEANKEVEDSCRYAEIPYIVVSPENTRYAFESEGIDNLKEVMGYVTREFVSAQIESIDYKLSKYGVHSAHGIALEISSGSFVRELVETGICAIDDAFGGFPRGGVVTVGAISSAGKTTLVNQIGDNLAHRGIPVLFATLEQSRYELAVMSMSRIIGSKDYDYAKKTPMAIDHQGKVKNENGTLKDGGARYATRSWIQEGPSSWTISLRNKILSAGNEYTSYADEYMHYMETEDVPTVTDIRNAAQAVREVHQGTSPVLIIDYLQLLKPMNERTDTRISTNENMSALRRLARDLNTVVIVISALNRASLSQGVTLSSLRESGGIEYASDMILGLQPSSMTEKLANGGKEVNQDGIKTNVLNRLIDDFRDQDVKECDLRVLKNRAGRVPKDGAHLYFDGRCSYFYGEKEVREAAGLSATFYSEEDEYI